VNVLFSTDFPHLHPIYCRNMGYWCILIYCDDNGDPIYVSKDLPAYLEKLRFDEFVDKPSE